MSAPAPAPRTGDLTLGWRWTVAVSWAAIMVCITVVAGAAEVINRSVWWIGNRGDRAPLVLALVPFVLPALAMVAAARAWRGVLLWSAAATASTALVAVGDIGGSPSSAVVMGALAVAGVCVTAAATTGRQHTRG